MLAISLRGMSARKLRTVLTAIAVVLGVALISGTYILTDTINKQFDDIFQTVDKGIDVSVSPKKVFNTDNGTNPPAFDQALVAKAKDVPGVQKVSGGVFDNGTIVGNNGKKVGSGGAPNFVTNPEPAPFDPFHYVSGHPPTANNDIAIDSFTAKKQHWHLGSTVRVGGEGPATPYTVVGVAKFGSVDSLAGAAIAIMPL